MTSVDTNKTQPLKEGGALMLGGEQDCYGGCTDRGQGFYGLMDEVRAPCSLCTLRTLYTARSPTWGMGCFTYRDQLVTRALGCGQSSGACAWQCITEAKEIHLVLFGMQDRTFGPYLAAMTNEILISAMPDKCNSRLRSTAFDPAGPQAWLHGYHDHFAGMCWGEPRASRSRECGCARLLGLCGQVRIWKVERQQQDIISWMRAESGLENHK
jgi:hypothetical protein